MSPEPRLASNLHMSEYFYSSYSQLGYARIHRCNNKHLNLNCIEAPWESQTQTSPSHYCGWACRRRLWTRTRSMIRIT